MRQDLVNAGDADAASRVTEVICGRLRESGDLRRAAQLCEETLAILPLPSSGRARWLHELGVLAHLRGAHAEAQERHLQSVRLYAAAGDTAGVALGYECLGVLAHARGDYQQAERYYLAAECFRVPRPAWLSPGGGAAGELVRPGPAACREAAGPASGPASDTGTGSPGGAATVSGRPARNSDDDAAARSGSRAAAPSTPADPPPADPPAGRAARPAGRHGRSRRDRALRGGALRGGALRGGALRGGALRGGALRRPAVLAAGTVAIAAAVAVSSGDTGPGGGLASVGLASTGPAGTGPAGTGPAGTGPAGARAAGAGPAGGGQARSGAASAGNSAASSGSGTAGAGNGPSGRYVAGPLAPGGPATIAAAGLAAAAAQRDRAAAAQWVASDVSAGAVAGCDLAMCGALRAAGVAAGELLLIGPGGQPDPLGSSVVVATAAIRGLLGGRLGTVYAPLVLARFGSGSARIVIRAAAPDGMAGFALALGSDRAERRAAGAQLLRNGRLSVTPAARRVLAAGLVDTRLLASIAALAQQQRLLVLGFGAAGPGAGPQVPLPSAELAVPGTGRGVPATAARSQLGSAAAFLRAQRPPYRASVVRLGTTGQGELVLRISFAEPGPLGLLAGSPPA